MKIRATLSRRALAPAALALLLAGAGAPQAPAQTAAPAQAAAAPAAATSDPFAALPADSEFVMVIDVRRALSEVVPRVLANDQKTLVQMNTAIDGAKTLSGVDLRAIRRVVAGVRGLSPNMKPDQVRGVVVVEGVDTAKLIAFARNAVKGKFTEADYQGTTVFTPITDNNKPINPLVEVAALDANTLVAGTPAELRASLDTAAGRAARAAATGADLASAVSRHASALVSMAFVVPESLKQMIAKGGGDQKQGGNPAGQMVAAALSSVRMLSAAVGMTPAGYDGFVGARLDSNERARSLADTLEGLKKLALMEAPKNDQDRVMQDLVRVTQISAQGDEVQVRTLVSQATVDALVKLGRQQKKAGTQPPASQPQQQKAPARRTGTRARRRPRA